MYQLILNLETYILNSKQKYNEDKYFDIYDYKFLFNKISNLTLDDFKDEEDFNFFQRYLNQTERNVLRSILIDKKHIDDRDFLFFINDMGWFHDLFKRFLIKEFKFL